jgi:penicillin-binding protein 1A
MSPMVKTKSIILPLFLVLSSVLTGGAAGLIAYSFWDLPEVRSLEEYRPSITSKVYSDDNRLLAEFYVENRTPVALAGVPGTFLQALIATEDSRFYKHPGIDARGIARAMYRNLRAGEIREGGSTLTQQLSKVLFLTPEKSYMRKLKEMALALRIEQRYTKNEILTLYCNQIYFGSGAYGVESAARIYFGKSAKELDLAECALLAGLPRSPKYYSPFREPGHAAGRRAYVLNRMALLGFISREQAEEAKKAPLPVQQPVAAGGPAPYFIEYIRQRVEERFGSSILYSGGLAIYTSINVELQNYAEQAVKSGLARIEARRGKKKDASLPPLQAALIAIEPASGRIQAMVGGRDFNESQFNRSWQALRQPGSVFKPFIYAAALERGFGATDMLDDSPLTVALDRTKSWKPENFTKTYQGPVTMRRALAWSLNVPTVRLFQKIGIDETIRFSRRLGIRSPLAAVPSLALGSSDLTLLELTSAYSVFAGHGVRVEPASILLITDSTGRTLYMNDSVPEQAMRPEIAYLATNLLRGVIEHGTGRKARELGRPSAGKTGTTNDYRDAWFIGYTPGLAAGVWVGYDDQRSIGPRETGARAALPLWLDFMKKACANRDPEDFTAPGGVIFRQIDPRSGLLSTEQCDHSFSEAFLPGTEPRRYCAEAAPVEEGSPPQDEAPQ